MLSSTLKQIRARMGMASARGFFQFLTRKGSLDFNYSYYMKIESGKVLPSAKAINQICLALPEEYGNEIILAFCAENFPKHQKLFSPKISQPDAKSIPPARNSRSADLMQKELTEKQVAVICSSKEHYYLFLLIVLARHALQRSELEKLFTGISLNSIISELENAKILFCEKEEISAAYPEWKFPPAAASKTLQANYKLLDSYDLEKNKFFPFQRVKNANLFRRISPRYFELVLQSIDLALQTTRLSDDLDTRQNNEIISLHVSVHRGKLPG